MRCDIQENDGFCLVICLFLWSQMHANALARKQEEEALIAIKRAKELLIEDLLTLEDLRILRNRFYGAFSSKGLVSSNMCLDFNSIGYPRLLQPLNSTPGVLVFEI